MTKNKVMIGRKPLKLQNAPARKYRNPRDIFLSEAPPCTNILFFH